MAETRRVGAFFALLNLLPLLGLPLIFYAVLTWGTGDASWLQGVVMNPGLISGDVWVMTGGDLFLATCLLVLYVELVKSTQTGAFAIINHSLSFAVVIITLLMFVTMRGFGTSEFFLLGLMQVVDVVAGLTITIAGARRDFGGGQVIGGPT